MPAAQPSLAALRPTLDKLPYAVLATIRDPVQVIDRDHRMVWCNTFTAEGRVWRAEDMIGRICHEKLFDRATPCPDCPAGEVFATGRSRVQEKMFPLPDGSHRWREVHSYPIHGPDGRTAFVVKIGFDITPQKREQGRLEKYLAYLETSLQDAAGDGPDRTVAEARERFGLTAREQEVLRLLAEGFTNLQMAKILAISPHTVKSHVVHVYDKLGVGDRAQAAVWAVRLKLV